MIEHKSRTRIPSWMFLGNSKGTINGAANFSRETVTSGHHHEWIQETREERIEKQTEPFECHSWPKCLLGEKRVGLKRPKETAGLKKEKQKERRGRGKKRKRKEEEEERIERKEEEEERGKKREQDSSSRLSSLTQNHDFGRKGCLFLFSWSTTRVDTVIGNFLNISQNKASIWVNLLSFVEGQLMRFCSTKRKIERKKSRENTRENHWNRHQTFKAHVVQKHKCCSTECAKFKSTVKSHEAHFVDTYLWTSWLLVVLFVEDSLEQVSALSFLWFHAESLQEEVLWARLFHRKRCGKGYKIVCLGQKLLQTFPFKWQFCWKSVVKETGMKKKRDGWREMKQKDKWQIKPIIKFSWVSDAINYNDSQDDVYCDSVFFLSLFLLLFV